MPFTHFARNAFWEGERGGTGAAILFAGAGDVVGATAGGAADGPAGACVCGEIACASAAPDHEVTHNAAAAVRGLIVLLVKCIAP